MACNYQGLSKAFLSVSSVVAIFVHFGTILSGSAVEAAVACNSTNCVLPDCQCASMDIPRGLTKEQVPQMVTITLDGSLRLQDYNKFYSNLLRGRKNPNGQNISFTFFVNHNFTDYSLATELAGMGHEFAVHSVTNRQPMSFWSSGENDDEIEREIVVMKNLLVRWAGVPEDRVVGYRSPFLASSEDQLRILHENDFLYDSTVVTDDMYWPFTLDYKSPICNSQNVCPDQALPGLWVIPNVNNVQNNNVSCSQIVNCVHPPKSTYDQWMNFFKHNFERHYNDSKVPFRINAQAAWFFEDNMAERLQAFMDFMDYLATLDDVYIVTMSQLIAWSKSPTPLSEISSFQPWKFNNGPTQRVCSNKTSCSYNCNGSTDFNFLHICGDEVCPESYPTLYNPEGIIDNDVCLSSTYEIQSMSVSSRLDIAVPSTSYELFQTTVSNSPQDQSSGDFANAHITSTVPISSNVISSMSASQSAVPSILNTMTTEGIRLQTSSDSTMPIASASEPARIIVSSMASNSAGQPEMMTTISQVEFLTESSSAMGTSTTGENSMQTVLNSMLLSESRTLLAETVAITTSSSITVSDSVSTVDALEDSMSGAVVASEQTSDALSMAITTSSSITVSDSVSDSTVDSLDDTTSGAVVASEQTSDALSMAITTSSSITAVVSVLYSTVEDSTSGTVVASEQTSDALSMAITTSSSITAVVSVLYSTAVTVDSLEDSTSGTVVASEQTSDALSMAITTSSSITAVVSVLDSTVDSLEDSTSGAVVASEQTSDALSMAITTSSSITVSDSVSDSTVDALDDTTSGAVVASEQTSDAALSMAITTSSSITAVVSVLYSTVEDSTSGTVVASEQTSDALSMAITTSSSITAVVSVLYSTVDSLEDSTSGTVVASEQTSDALSMAITTSSSITAVVSVLDSTVDSLEDSTSGAVVASEQTSDALSMAITTSSSITAVVSVLYSTVEDSTSGTVVASEQTSDALSMAITTSSSITAVVSVLDSTVDSLEDSTSGTVVASEQTSDALSMAITTSSSITAVVSVLDSTVDSLEDSTSGAVVASEQTSDALSMAITTSSSITAVVSVLYSTVEDSTSGTVVASEQTSDALSMAITTSSYIKAVLSVSDSTVDSLDDTTSGAVLASEQTSDVPSSSGIMRTHYPSSSSMGTFTTDKGYMQTVTLPGESSALLAETIAITTSSSITAVVSVSDSASDYLAETLSSAVEASKQTSVSGAEIMSTQYLSSGTSESAHSSPPVSSSISVSTTSPVGGGLQGGSNRGLGLSPGVAAAIAIGVVVIVATAVAVTAGLGVVAVKSELAATVSQSTILSNPLTSPV